jgi:hypothetical protein
MMRSDLARLLDAGFTEQQAGAILEVIERARDQHVTRDYLDLRLRDEFQRFKRSILLWILAMQAPTYAALIYLLLKVG